MGCAGIWRLSSESRTQGDFVKRSSGLGVARSHVLTLSRFMPQLHFGILVSVPCLADTWKTFLFRLRS